MNRLTADCTLTLAAAENATQAGHQQWSCNWASVHGSQRKRPQVTSDYDSHGVSSELLNPACSLETELLILVTNVASGTHGLKVDQVSLIYVSYIIYQKKILSSKCPTFLNYRQASVMNTSFIMKLQPRCPFCPCVFYTDCQKATVLHWLH